MDDSRLSIDDLPTCFVVEVGKRQAWLFIRIADDRPEKGRETRLYLDADWSITSSDTQPDLEPVLQLMILNGLSIESAHQEGNPPDLVLLFHKGSQLRVSGEARHDTVGEPWWFALWRATVITEHCARARWAGLGEAGRSAPVVDGVALR